VRHFYDLLNSGRYARAWTLVPTSVRNDAGGFANWKGATERQCHLSPRISLCSRSVTIARRSFSAYTATRSMLMRAPVVASRKNSLELGRYMRPESGGTKLNRFPKDRRWHANRERFRLRAVVYDRHHDAGELHARLLPLPGPCERLRLRGRLRRWTEVHRPGAGDGKRPLWPG
jgi:hypothetical protein